MWQPPGIEHGRNYPSNNKDLVKKNPGIGIVCQGHAGILPNSGRALGSQAAPFAAGSHGFRSRTQPDDRSGSFGGDALPSQGIRNAAV